MPIAFSYVFCIACRKSGAFAPQKCIRSNHSVSRATYAQPKQKAIPYGMTFCFGGDKRDRTADLMTASHALSQLSYTPIGLGYSSRYGGKLQALFSIFRNFFEEVRFRRKGGGQLPRKTAVRRQLPFPPIVKDENGPLPYCPRRRRQRRQAGEARSKSNLYFEAAGERHPRGHFRMETSSRASVSLQRL